MNRRDFFRKGLLWLCYVAGGGFLAYPVFSFMAFKKERKRTILFHPHEQAGDIHFKEGAYLIKEGTDHRVLSARCPHLGCTVGFDSAAGQFRCPCHGSVFTRSGKWISGPAQKDLHPIPATQDENGDIQVEVNL
ncbi:MAG: ubiquinol-cytochrome c reductase iron-sulfur subunit [Deltaproteobacteria bacterium]|nr:ubiquinol-cytochrome c reductase iron-sulfur subunit [Deltaproteobacteria bacterium]